MQQPPDARPQPDALEQGAADAPGFPLARALAAVPSPPAAVPQLLVDLLRQWVTHTLVGLYVLRRGAVLWANPRFAQIADTPLPALVGRPALSLVHADDRATVSAHARAMLRGRTSAAYEYRIRTDAGADRWVMETVVSVRHGGEHLTLGSVLDITEHKLIEARLAHQTLHDPLTGLPNRVLLLDRLARALGRQRAGVAVLYGDLDGFKAVNDAHGHHAGDELLRALAERLRPRLRPGATLARLGGDEFVVLLEDAADAADALGVAAGLQAALAEPLIATGHALRVSLSVGVALAGPGRASAEALLRAADVALYRAKRRGPGRAALAGTAAPPSVGSSTSRGSPPPAAAVPPAAPRPPGTSA